MRRGDFDSELEHVHGAVESARAWNRLSRLRAAAEHAGDAGLDELERRASRLCADRVWGVRKFVREHRGLLVGALEDSSPANAVAVAAVGEAAKLEIRLERRADAMLLELPGTDGSVDAVWKAAAALDAEARAAARSRVGGGPGAGESGVILREALEALETEDLAEADARFEVELLEDHRDILREFHAHDLRVMVLEHLIWRSGLEEDGRRDALRARLEAEKLGFWKRVKAKIISWWRKFVNLIKRVFGVLKKDAASLDRKDYEKVNYQARYPFNDVLAERLVTDFKTRLNRMVRIMTVQGNYDEYREEIKKMDALGAEIREAMKKEERDILKGATLYNAVEHAKKTALSFVKHGEDMVKPLAAIESALKRSAASAAGDPVDIAAQVREAVERMAVAARLSAAMATRLTSWAKSVQNNVAAGRTVILSN